MDLEKLINLFDSDNIFIKSIYYQSPSTIEDGLIFSPNVLGDIIFLLQGFDSISEVRLTLKRVRNISLHFEYEINFSVTHDAFDNTYKVTFDSVSESIICQDLEFETIGY